MMTGSAIGRVCRLGSHTLMRKLILPPKILLAEKEYIIIINCRHCIERRKTEGKLIHTQIENVHTMISIFVIMSA
jgi:hypothetical protein